VHTANVQLSLQSTVIYLVIHLVWPNQNNERCLSVFGS